jgi:hypothetical protein
MGQYCSRGRLVSFNLLALIYPFLGFPESNFIRLFFRVADLMRFTL